MYHEHRQYYLRGVKIILNIEAEFFEESTYFKENLFQIFISLLERFLVNFTMQI
jgi:hypothetical protein